MASCKQTLSGLALAAALLTLGLPLRAAPEALRGVPFAEVVLADSFWAPRIETNRIATIPHLLRELEKQGSLGGLARVPMSSQRGRSSSSPHSALGRSVSMATW